MVGDHNTFRSQWRPIFIGLSPDLLNSNHIESKFYSILPFLNFSRFNRVLNCTGSMLDLVLSDINNLGVNKSMDPLVPRDNYHPDLLITFSIYIIEPIEYQFIYVIFF